MAASQIPLAAPSVAAGMARYCLPSQPCWPSLDAWSALNSSVAGRLIQPDGPVPSGHPRNADADWRLEHPAAVMFLNFADGRGLVKDDPARMATSAPVNNNTSDVDRTPAYVLEALTPSDVVSAVNFARENRLRLRIKSTGHDYLGRSSDEGSFTLWTRRLNHSRFEEEFVPEGAPEGTKAVPALITGAGSILRDLNKAADEAGVIVTGGVSQTIGAGGGFTLGGGHGPLAPLHGLAADNALEYTVVTANGTILRCSPYQHSSLFTALRGGGSAFAVVLDIAFKAHAPPAGFVGIFGSFALRRDANVTAAEAKETWRTVLKRWTELQPKLSQAGPFAGYTYVRKPEATPFAYILPSDDIQLAKDLFTPVFEALAADPNVEVDWEYVESKTWFELWSGAFTDALHSLDAVGIPLLLGSRLVPKDVVEQRTQDLANFLADSASPAIVHLVAGGAVEKEPEFPSSVNPGWRTALLHIDLPVSWPTSAHPTKISALASYLTSHTLALSNLATSLGHPQASYSSESNYHEEDWQKVWYGEDNYERLLEAKREWDPEGVFSARRAVGSEVVGW